MLLEITVVIILIIELIFLFRGKGRRLGRSGTRPTQFCGLGREVM
jgi:hypothetical protein